MPRIIITFLLSFFLSNPAFAENTERYSVQVAVVDIQLVLDESIAVQDMQKNITKIGDEIENMMRAKEKELKKDEEIILKRRNSVSEADFEKEVAAFNKKLSDVQQMMQEKKTNLERAHVAAMEKVQGSTIAIVKAIAEEKNINLVLPSSQVFYATDKLNITKMVISRLNQQLKTLAINY